jgi:hypothetical protein
VVQDWALDLMMALEGKERRERQIDDVKRALLTSRPEMAKDLFPEWFVDDGEGPEERSRTGAERVDNLDLSDTTGEMFFEGKVSQEQAEKVLQQMLAHPEGVLTGVEFDGAPSI